MESLDIKKAHEVLLGIAKAFVKVCDDNQIPYYMLGGTMLGAIRHKGFIPWDDDMDFGVPREFYDMLIMHLEQQLPYPYRCCTYKNGLASSVIFKIDDCRTLINDAFSTNKSIGLNIDIFPLDYCSPKDTVWKKERLLTYIYRAKFANNEQWSFSRKLLNKIIGIIIPWSKEEINQHKETLLKRLHKGEHLSNVFGAWGIKECIPIEWYGDGIKYKFENIELCGLLQYDKYLSQLYGDYMTPPECNKHVHLEGVFWRDL